MEDGQQDNKKFMFKKIIIPTVLIVIIILVVMFFYNKTESPSGVIEEGISLIYDCPQEVTSKQEAVDCFNLYFTEQNENIEIEISEVSENEVFMNNGFYYIQREDGYGSPFFIKDSKVMFQHG